MMDEAEFRTLLEKAQQDDGDAKTELWKRYELGCYAIANTVCQHYQVQGSEWKDISEQLQGCAKVCFFKLLPQYDINRFSIGAFTQFINTSVRNAVSNEMKTIARNWGTGKRDKDGNISYEKKQLVPIDSYVDSLVDEKGAEAFELAWSHDIYEKTEGYRIALSRRDQVIFTHFRDDLMGIAHLTNQDIADELCSMGYRITEEGVRRRIKDKFTKELRLLFKDS